MNTFPLTPPLPEGYDAARDIYPPHDHVGYRWAMIVDCGPLHRLYRLCGGLLCRKQHRHRR